MGQAFDILFAALFGAITVVIVALGVRRGDSPKRIRERGSFTALLALIGLRGVLPKSSLGTMIYFLALIALVLTALWKGPRSPDH